MPSIKKLECWEIMCCDDSINCAARKNPARSCWSIAREITDYRAEFDICSDCIVYMVKNDIIVLSAHEINEVRKEGEPFSCALSL